MFNPLRDLTVFFEVNPYSARVCPTLDVDTCSSPFIPIERCEKMIVDGGTLDGTDGPDRLVSPIDSPSAILDGFAGDDVLFARKDGDVIDAKEGNDLIFVNSVGSTVIRPGDGEDVIFFTTPTLNPANRVTI